MTTPLLPNFFAGRWQTGAGTGTPLFDPVLGTELARVSSAGIDLEEGFAFARQQGYAWVSSSLLYSRYQPHEVIKTAGETLAAQPDAPGFAYRDFRADWQAGIDRSKAMELYRQPYCGCVYSESDRYQKQLLRCIKG